MDLGLKIQKLSDKIQAFKTQKTRNKKWNDYLNEWNIFKLSDKKRQIIKELFELNNLEAKKPNTGEYFNILTADRYDNLIIKYAEKEKEPEKLKGKNIYRPNYSVASEECPKKPYTHQKEAFKELNKFYTKGINKKGILVLPTGAGKTFTALRWLLRNVYNNNKKIIWIAHRHELLEQVNREIQKLSFADVMPDRKDEKISVHLISGSHDPAIKIRKDDDIIIASRQTLNRNLKHLESNFLEYNKDVFLVIDEAHHATAKTYRNIINLLESRCNTFNLLGLTATPTRTSEKERSFLSKVFPDDIIYKKDLQDMIVNNILAKPIFEPIKTNENFTEKDFTVDEIKLLQSNFDLPEKIKQQIISRAGRNQLIVDHYVQNKDKYGQSIFFALDRTHAQNLSDKLLQYGIKSDYVISGMQSALGIGIDKEHNKEAIKRFRDEELDVLVNVNILTEGADLPKAKSAFLLRPTKSETLMTQMIGRVLRGEKAGGTKEAFIVSFVDNWHELVTWKSPSELFVDENDLLDTTKDYKKYKIEFISIKLIQQFASLADNLVITEELESYPSIMRIPVGWYSFELEQYINEDEVSHVSCKILIFQQHQEAFKMLSKDMEDLYNRFDIDNNKELDESEREHMVSYIMQNYFENIDYPEPQIKPEDLNDFIEYYDNTGDIPTFFDFEERYKFDIARLVNEVSNLNMRRNEEAEFIDQQWEGKSGKSIWKEFYNDNFDYFRDDFDREMKKTLHPEKTKKLEIPEVEYTLENLENMRLFEWPANLYKDMRQKVYDKWNKENPDKIIEGKDKWRYHIDHIIPFSKGGKTELKNLQPLLAHENIMKGDKSI